MRYKSSRYNILVKVDGSHLLFNSFRGSLAKIEKEKVGRVKKFLNMEDTMARKKSDLFNQLVAGGFIISYEFDEFAYLKLAHLKTKFNTENLELIIIVTKACNFRCSYCCEDTNSNEYITEEMIERLVTFVEAKAQRAKTMLISWFGGEPLVRFSVIEKLTDHFTKICEKYGCQYAAFLTTNGYLLTSRVADKLPGLKINGVQITLDGPKHIHDKRRMLKNGRGTYDVLLDNISYIIQKEISVKVNIRCNVDMENMAYLKNWLANFPDDLRSKVNIYFCPVTAGGEDKCPAKSRKEVCIHEDNSRIIPDLMHFALDKGFVLDFKLGGKNVYCNADKLNHFVIGADLSLIACPHLMNKIGYIDVNGEAVYNLSKKVNWLSQDPFDGDGSDCKNCKLLPICGGGCNLPRFTGERTWCTIFKYDIEEWVRLWYKPQATIVN